jgi:hypothetical protein
MINAGRLLVYGLIKKPSRKFEQMALRNEINVTNAGNCTLSVGLAKDRPFGED